MFKKKVLLALGMAAVLSTGCAATSVWAEENADVQAETESTDTEENSEAEGEAEEANPEIEEGYTTELDGCTKVVSWCKNGDNYESRNRLHFPNDGACEMAGKSSTGRLCGLYL